jgi:hypothetical protein
MAAPGKKKLLALDTNLLFDLAADKDFAHTFREVYQERGYSLVVPPSRQQSRERNRSAVFGPRDAVHPDPELAGGGKRNAHKLDFEIFIAAIILYRNSQVCFHKLMIKAIDRKVTRA